MKSLMPPDMDRYKNVFIGWETDSVKKRVHLNVLNPVGKSSSYYYYFIYYAVRDRTIKKELNPRASQHG